MNDRDKKIAFIKKRMKELGYNQRSLSMNATGKPDTVRNLFRGRSNNWRQDNYQAIMKILDPASSEAESAANVDEATMRECAIDIQAEMQSQNAMLSPEQIILAATKLYNLVMEYRRKGKPIVSNEALASLIIKQEVA